MMKYWQKCVAMVCVQLMVFNSEPLWALAPWRAVTIDHPLASRTHEATSGPDETWDVVLLRPVDPNQQALNENAGVIPRIVGSEPQHAPAPGGRSRVWPPSIDMTGAGWVGKLKQWVGQFRGNPTARPADDSENQGFELQTVQPGDGGDQQVAAAQAALANQRQGDLPNTHRVFAGPLGDQEVVLRSGMSTKTKGAIGFGVFGLLSLILSVLGGTGQFSSSAEDNQQGSEESPSSASATPSPSSDATSSSSPTSSPSLSRHATSSFSAIASPSAQATLSSSATATASPSAQASPSSAPSLTVTSSVLVTPSSTSAPTVTASPSASFSGTPAATGSPTPTQSNFPTPSPSPSAQPFVPLSPNYRQFVGIGGISGLHEDLIHYNSDTREVTAFRALDGAPRSLGSLPTALGTVLEIHVGIPNTFFVVMIDGKKRLVKRNILFDPIDPTPLFELTGPEMEVDQELTVFPHNQAAIIHFPDRIEVWNLSIVNDDGSGNIGNLSDTFVLSEGAIFSKLGENSALEQNGSADELSYFDPADRKIHAFAILNGRDQGQFVIDVPEGLTITEMWLQKTSFGSYTQFVQTDQGDVFFWRFNQGETSEDVQGPFFLGGSFAGIQQISFSHNGHLLIVQTGQGSTVYDTANFEFSSSASPESSLPPMLRESSGAFHFLSPDHGDVLVEQLPSELNIYRVILVKPGRSEIEEGQGFDIVPLAQIFQTVAQFESGTVTFDGNTIRMLAVDSPEEGSIGGLENKHFESYSFNPPRTNIGNPQKIALLNGRLATMFEDGQVVVWESNGHSFEQRGSFDINEEIGLSLEGVEDFRFPVVRTDWVQDFLVVQESPVLIRDGFNTIEERGRVFVLDARPAFARGPGATEFQERFPVNHLFEPSEANAFSDYGLPLDRKSSVLRLDALLSSVFFDLKTGEVLPPTGFQALEEHDDTTIVSRGRQDTDITYLKRQENGSFNTSKFSSGAVVSGAIGALSFLNREAQGKSDLIFFGNGASLKQIIAEPGASVEDVADFEDLILEIEPFFLANTGPSVGLRFQQVTVLRIGLANGARFLYHLEKGEILSLPEFDEVEIMPAISSVLAFPDHPEISSRNGLVLRTGGSAALYGFVTADGESVPAPVLIDQSGELGLIQIDVVQPVDHADDEPVSGMNLISKDGSLVEVRFVTFDERLANQGNDVRGQSSTPSPTPSPSALPALEQSYHVPLTNLQSFRLGTHSLSSVHSIGQDNVIQGNIIEVRSLLNGFVQATFPLGNAPAFSDYIYDDSRGTLFLIVEGGHQVVRLDQNGQTENFGPQENLQAPAVFDNLGESFFRVLEDGQVVVQVFNTENGELVRTVKSQNPDVGTEVPQIKVSNSEVLIYYPGDTHIQLIPLFADNLGFLLSIEDLGGIQIHKVFAEPFDGTSLGSAGRALFQLEPGDPRIVQYDKISDPSALITSIYGVSEDILNGDINSMVCTISHNGLLIINTDQGAFVYSLSENGPQRIDATLVVQQPGFVAQFESVHSDQLVHFIGPDRAFTMEFIDDDPSDPLGTTVTAKPFTVFPDHTRSIQEFNPQAGVDRVSASLVSVQDSGLTGHLHQRPFISMADATETLLMGNVGRVVARYGNNLVVSENGITSHEPVAVIELDQLFADPSALAFDTIGHNHLIIQDAQKTYLLDVASDGQLGRLKTDFSAGDLHPFDAKSYVKSQKSNELFTSIAFILDNDVEIVAAPDTNSRHLFPGVQIQEGDQVTVSGLAFSVLRKNQSDDADELIVYDTSNPQGIGVDTEGADLQTATVMSNENVTFVTSEGELVLQNLNGLFTRRVQLPDNIGVVTSVSVLVAGLGLDLLLVKAANQQLLISFNSFGQAIVGQFSTQAKILSEDFFSGFPVVHVLENETLHSFLYNQDELQELSEVSALGFADIMPIAGLAGSFTFFNTLAVLTTDGRLGVIEYLPSALQKLIEESHPGFGKMMQFASKLGGSDQEIISKLVSLFLHPQCGLGLLAVHQMIEETLKGADQLDPETFEQLHMTIDHYFNEQCAEKMKNNQWQEIMTSPALYFLFLLGIIGLVSRVPRKDSKAIIAAFQESGDQPDFEALAHMTEEESMAAGFQALMQARVGELQSPSARGPISQALNALNLVQKLITAA